MQGEGLYKEMIPTEREEYKKNRRKREKGTYNLIEKGTYNNSSSDLPKEGFYVEFVFLTLIS